MVIVVKIEKKYQPDAQLLLQNIKKLLPLLILNPIPGKFVDFPYIKSRNRLFFYYKSPEYIINKALLFSEMP
jgi:hypothetical protein